MAFVMQRVWIVLVCVAVVGWSASQAEGAEESVVAGGEAVQTQKTQQEKKAESEAPFRFLGEDFRTHAKIDWRWQSGDGGIAVLTANEVKANIALKKSLEKRKIDIANMALVLLHVGPSPDLKVVVKDGVLKDGVLTCTVSYVSKRNQGGPIRMSARPRTVAMAVDQNKITKVILSLPRDQTIEAKIQPDDDKPTDSTDAEEALWGKPVDGIQLGLHMDQEKLKNGEQWTGKLYARNTTTKTISIPEQSKYAISIVDENGSTPYRSAYIGAGRKTSNMLKLQPNRKVEVGRFETGGSRPGSEVKGSLGNIVLIGWSLRAGKTYTMSVFRGEAKSNSAQVKVED